MPTVAEQLRDTRKAQKLSIQRVAELTNIKSEHLRALEEGNYTTFAAPIYVRPDADDQELDKKRDELQLALDEIDQHGEAWRAGL